eukprot:CAMPEP_0201884270 /NCGR_PEP_ID=MMETSP0902-20130614/16850_1 /ASSEMBLY_ACC=CAM_ASM_000551 /TAXON_ID=420261 /ORGANISM="Thalassiosira antarctica, Strain CCMP982" /LENGTH=501 /DNA_ID=CAMNT_0048413203 /DNA_START=50 /DNA_END=1555 /DNA_ORIENTATION=-
MSTPSTTTHEVHLAIYDLSMGMARGLSAQFLGPQHAVEIIPHTAIVAYGKEYFFGQGIEWCSPHEFRATRGIQPIEIQPLGHTSCTEQQFEDWCRAQAANGSFGTQSYDLIHRNCNNFSEEAARQGLRLQKGVPQWILEVPQKFLSSPMGMMVRPILEQMQISNNAPTNLPTGGAGSVRMAQPTIAPTTSSAAAAVTAVNPWANIPAAASTPATGTSSPAKQTSPATPLLDKQSALLSTDTGVVKICIYRLKPEQEQSELLSKLADTNASWTQKDINSVHQYLRSVIDNDTQYISYALMLLRLIVLRQPSSADLSSNEEPSQSAQHVAKLLLEDKLKTLPTRSMAWCVLSNAMGSTQPPDWDVSTGTDSLIDRALSDSDPSKDGVSSPSHVSLRQSAAAFLYNLTICNDGGTDDAVENGNTELSEGVMSILLGCLEHLHEEADVTTCKRHYMAIGQLLKSRRFGETAVGLVKDLGLVDEEIGKGKNKEVEGLAKEVAVLLQ